MIYDTWDNSVGSCIPIQNSEADLKLISMESRTTLVFQIKCLNKANSIGKKCGDVITVTVPMHMRCCIYTRLTGLTSPIIVPTVHQLFPQLQETPEIISEEMITEIPLVSNQTVLACNYFLSTSLLLYVQNITGRLQGSKETENLKQIRINFDSVKDNFSKALTAEPLAKKKAWKMRIVPITKQWRCRTEKG